MSNDDTARSIFEQNAVDPVFLPSALSDVASDFEDASAAAGLVASVRLQGKVGKKAKTAAIVLAGGSGERFGHDGGKQIVEIAGRPTLAWSIMAFDATEDIGIIVVVCPEDRMQEYWALAIDPHNFVTPIVMAPAGASRQESAFSGLEYVPDNYEYVALHDGARPLISPELITHTINTLKGTLDADGAIVATPAVDTLKVVENGVIVGTPDRRVFWNAQTPQVFRSGVYRRAHASALAEGFIGTDDASLIERMGGKVLVVEGKRDNIKLTVPEDYRMLSAIVQSQGLVEKDEGVDA
ncbi:2-C-methyl-D-erythritol 4-phosphate cytidylyltransferase [Slackia equolifaciens]|uniref:2-C-methyl-D-erythritol 4-phosphate cytidylyltransferase n=1 Tax=Slackia equolifaciens TaxID=498718 RepID=A0A3N0ARU1_9ACTN|nr:2-C-methyl-D-erythritol 4-phosphate cytidylyltransferase [Slackia equolifaciens]RNL37577.1 2-C-methyl-D-erythritol 4-phosphate cytidylyltransferase [Slackia equolifaciens]